MRFVFQLVAVRKATGFGNPFYMLEARERSLTLIPLPRRWAGTWTLFFTLCILLFTTALYSVVELAVQFYPAAIIVATVAYSPFLILSTILSYGWSQRLAWRFSRTSEKRLHPKIKDIKRGIFSSKIDIYTEEAGMSLVVRARRGTIARALDLAEQFQ